MNKNIKDKQLTTGDEKSKSHQAYAMELSRLKSAQKICVDTNNCSEYNSLGGDTRLRQIEPVVEVPRKADEFRRKVQKDTNPNNTYQEEDSPTEIKMTKISRDSNHSGGEKHKILTNAQALNEEISNIRYLIEYMNNNNK